MDIARRLFNDQHSTTSLIDLFGKRHKIDENDKFFDDCVETKQVII